MLLHNVLVSLYLPGMWALFKLPVAYPRLTSANEVLHTSMLCTGSTDVASGIEIESPQKQLSTAQEFPCTIAEIGKVSTSWISQRGVRDIIQLRAEEQIGNKLKTKCGELRFLAVECLKAFQSSGLGTSDDPQVKKATDLCLLYAPNSRSSPAVQPERRKCEIADLWKRDAAAKCCSTSDPWSWCWGKNWLKR